MFLAMLSADFSNPFWDSVFWCSTVATAIFGGLAVMAGFLAAVVGTKTASAAQRKSAEQIAQANARAADANKQAALAIEGTTLAQKDVAQAKLETEKLKAQLAWRDIDPAKALDQTIKLSAEKGAVFIEYVQGDPESLYLAIKLSEVFGNAGWHVSSSGNQYGPTLIFGVFVPDNSNNGKNVSLVRDALRALDVEFTPTIPPSPPISFGRGFIPGSNPAQQAPVVEIVVGTKTRASL